MARTLWKTWRACGAPTSHRGARLFPGVARVDFELRDIMVLQARATRATGFPQGATSPVPQGFTGVSQSKPVCAPTDVGLLLPLLNV